jgi:hypothetical protein
MDLDCTGRNIRRRPCGRASKKSQFPTPVGVLPRSTIWASWRGGSAERKALTMASQQQTDKTGRRTRQMEKGEQTHQTFIGQGSWIRPGHAQQRFTPCAFHSQEGWGGVGPKDMHRNPQHPAVEPHRLRGSGDTTLISNIATPFCTRPRATIRDLVDRAPLTQTHRVRSRVPYERKCVRDLGSAFAGLGVSLCGTWGQPSGLGVSLCFLFFRPPEAAT